MNEENENSEIAIPKHVAIIMDGNGRWAKRKGRMRIFGHQAGVKSVRRAVKFASQQKLSALTLYAFSSENWSRPESEVSALMELFMRALNKEVKSLHENNIRLRIIGDTSRFSERLRKQIEKSEHLTQNNGGLCLNIAANYGGRWDIVNATQHIAKQVSDGYLTVDDISEKSVAQYICLSDLPPVDLMIRTGGEHRLSNFLLWQCAYAELYFTEVLWPDFDELVFAGALNEFAQRERRFGGA